MYDSLKRQVGRDAGKVVSNFVFGDSHSTPHRNTNSGKRESNNEFNLEKLKIQTEDVKQKDLYLLDNAVINAVDQVIAREIPNDEIGIIKILQELEIQLKINKWLPIHKGEVAKIRNKFPDAVLIKYEQCVYELKYLECNAERLNLATKVLSKYRKVQFLSKYKLYLLIIVFIFSLTIIGLIGG